MSLTARLHIEGHNNESTGSPILACDYSLSQETDSRGMAVSVIRAGIINITIRGTDDPEILQWMTSRDTTKNGKIEFSGVIATGSRRRIEFEDGFLVSYHETFTDQSDITIQLTISARQITVSGVNHENSWNTSS